MPPVPIEPGKFGLGTIAPLHFSFVGKEEEEEEGRRHLPCVYVAARLAMPQMQEKGNAACGLLIKWTSILKK